MKTAQLTLLFLSISVLCAMAARPDYVEGEVLVLYKAASSVMSANAPADRLSLSRRTFSQLSQRTGRTVQHIRDSSRTTAQLVTELRSDPRVEAV